MGCSVDGRLLATDIADLSLQRLVREVYERANRGETDMQIEVIGVQNNEVVARGDIYRNGVKLTTLKMYFETGVLNPKSVRNGAVFILTTEWINHMHEIGKVAWQEV